MLYEIGPLNHVEVWHAKIDYLPHTEREKNKTFLNAFGKYQLFNKMRNIYKFREINCISWNFGIFTFSCYQTNLPNLFFHFVYFGSKSFCSSIQQNSDLSREIFNGKDWETRRRFTAWKQLGYSLFNAIFLLSSNKISLSRNIPIHYFKTDLQ